MTAAAGVRVEGLDQLVRTMNRAKADLSDLKDAHRAAAALVARSATPPRRSGDLAGSIRPARQARRARVLAGGARVPYAGAIHWGWPSRGISAQPFLSDAATTTESQWVPMYRADVQRALDKIRGA